MAAELDPRFLEPLRKQVGDYEAGPHNRSRVTVRENSGDQVARPASAARTGHQDGAL